MNLVFLTSSFVGPMDHNKVFLQREAREVNGSVGAHQEVLLQSDGEIALPGVNTQGEIEALRQKFFPRLDRPRVASSLGLLSAWNFGAFHIIISFLLNYAGWQPWTVESRPQRRLTFPSMTNLARAFPIRGRRRRRISADE